MTDFNSGILSNCGWLLPDDLGVTIAFTTAIVIHEIVFVREVADRIIFIRDGVVVEDCPAKQVVSAL